MVDRTETNKLPDNSCGYAGKMPERMERKAKPTVVDRENDFILHPTQKTKDADTEEDPAIAAAAARKGNIWTIWRRSYVMHTTEGSSLYVLTILACMRSIR